MRAAHELLRLGAALGASDQYGWTALHVAVHEGHAAMARCLAKWDSDARVLVRARNSSGKRPCDVARNQRVRDELDTLWCPSKDSARTLFFFRSKRAAFAHSYAPGSFIPAELLSAVPFWQGRARARGSTSCAAWRARSSTWTCPGPGAPPRSTSARP